MSTRRRSFLKRSLGMVGMAATGISSACGRNGAGSTSPDSSPPRDERAAPSEAFDFDHLKPMTKGIVPISQAERAGRIEKARRLMAEHNIDALYLEGGASLFYYTGIRWGRSERMAALVIPRKGELAYVCPAFEEARFRELMLFGDDLRVWEEDENPAERVAQILRDRGLSTGRVGMEEQVRFFLFDAVRKQAPQIEYVSATPVVYGGRVYKSPAEIALMQRAMDITLEAYKAVSATLYEGMSQTEFKRRAQLAHRALGVDGHAWVQFGKSTAYPHGSKEVTYLKEGDMVLMDGGCSVEGYRSDISRTFVFGHATGRQREIWELEKRAQAAGFAAAKLGAPCEAVDAAARKVIVDAGFGPGYKVPGLPHRTGHGIGLEGHEGIHLVKGNKTPLAPGMCFSDEPMIAIYGEFGVRLEDCFYMSEDGARFFTKPSKSIDEPFG